MNVVVSPLKRFGQNFLTDKNIIQKIVNAVSVSKKDCILEIGPGTGLLTLPIARKAKKVIAIEVDRGLYQNLLLESKPFKNIELINCDILKFNLKKYLKKTRIKSVRVVANLPYYITAPIIEFLFNNIKFINDIYITVQKEVGERIVAGPKEKAYGSFSCFVHYFTQPEILFPIKKGSFWPAPKVDSCFLKLKPSSTMKRKLKIRSGPLFFRVIRSAFGQRRKRLYASLSQLMPKADLRLLPAEGLLSSRPDELGLEEFAYLSNLIFEAVVRNQRP